MSDDRRPRRGSQPEQGNVRPTSVRDLLMSGLAGGIAGWLVVKIADTVDATPPQVPWSAPIALLLAAAFVGILAWRTHQQIQVRHERPESSTAVALLVLGKASAMAGVAVAVGYLGFALHFIDRIDVSAPRERVIRAGVAIVAGVVLCVAGLLLERACKVPPGKDEDPSDTSATD